MIMSDWCPLELGNASNKHQPSHPMSALMVFIFWPHTFTPSSELSQLGLAPGSGLGTSQLTQ